jgi:hypothetical protein
MAGSKLKENPDGIVDETPVEKKAIKNGSVHVAPNSNTLWLMSRSRPTHYRRVATRESVCRAIFGLNPSRALFQKELANIETASAVKKVALGGSGSSICRDSSGSELSFK